MRLIDADALPKYALSAAEVARAVENAPTIEAEPVRRGKWKMIDDTEFRVPGWYCSVCNYHISDRDGKYNYCPWCGALMEV